MAGNALISVREAARRLDLPEQSLYNARKRGTIRAAEGPEVPEGVWFEVTELDRWAIARHANRRRGRPKKEPPK